MSYRVHDLERDVAIGLSLQLVVTTSAYPGDGAQRIAIERGPHHCLDGFAFLWRRVRNGTAYGSANPDDEHRKSQLVRGRQRLLDLAAPGLSIRNHDERLRVGA